MSTVNLIEKKDAIIQYIEKLQAKNSIDLKNFKLARKTQKRNTGLQLHRTRRHIFNNKKDTCKGLQITSAVTGGLAGVASSAATAASSIPFFGAPFAAVSSGIAAGHFIAKAAAEVAYIAMDCASIPFDEIKEIMDKRFNNLDKAVDRNYAALQEVSKLVSKTLTAVEQTRMEMHQNFNHVLVSIKSSRVEPVLSKLNNFIRYFDAEKDQINILSRDNYITRIDEINNVLNYLKDSRTPKGDSLHTLLGDIMYQNFATPTNADDIIGISALYALHYGTQTYVSVLYFLIEQHSYIADYYFQDGDLKKFNDHFGKIQDVFQKFRNALIGSDAIIDKVIDIIAQAQVKDFIADDRALTENLSEKVEELKKMKDQILEMALPVIKDVPGKFNGKMTFKPPSVDTPLGDWKDERRVYYAMQYKDGDEYSKIGAWSEPLVIYGEANPTFKIPVDSKRRTRLIYRKFDNLKPQLVGIIENKYQIEYRDIHRDLYNAASWSSAKMAEKAVDTLLDKGANSTAIFDQGRRALHSAAYGGNPVIAIDKLKPADINIRDDNGYTPLHIAAEAGNDDLIKVLVQNGANVNAQTFAEELTPIHLAARKGFDFTVQSLLECQGIDMSLGDREGFTPLHSAVAGGLPVVEAMLSHKSVDVNQKSNRGLSALHLAAMNEYMDVAEALFNTGKLNINIEAEGKMTPLHFATISGHLEMVRFLLNNGADINVKSVTNWTPLHFAISLSKTDIALEFLQSRAIDLNPKADDNITPMHIACGSGQNDIVQMLLLSRPSHIVQDILNTKTKDGLTPLHIAIMNKHEKHQDIVSHLIDNGADIEARTNEGLTPLLAAATVGELDLVNLLERNRADMNAVDANDNNVLHLAAQNGHLDIVRHFVENRSFSLKKGVDVIKSAIPKGHLKVIQYLVDNKGISPTCNGDVNYFCPLSEACKYGHLDIVRYIASKYGNIDFSGVPIQIAAQYGHLHLVKYMIKENGAEPNKFENGKTPMLLAAKYGWLSIVKYLHEKQNIALDIGRDHYKKTTVQLAITSGNLYLVKYLLDKNLGPSALEDPEYNETPLHFAVDGPDNESVNDKRSSSVLRYLVDEKHYNVNAQSKYGYTPLHDAVQHESFYAIKFLISRGAKLYIKSTSHETALDLAIKYKKRVEIQQFLQMQEVCNAISNKENPAINDGYNVNTVCIDVKKVLTNDIYHTTALHLAAFTGAINTVKLLLKLGANVNARDEEGNVPLHMAVQNGKLELINILIESGADITLKNQNSQTPKDLAKENHAIAIVELLMQAQVEQNRGRLTRVKKSINQEASLGTETSSKTHDNLLTYIIEKGCGDSGATPLCLQSSSGNQDSIDVRGAQCLDSNVSLGLLLAQNFLNKKFPLPNFSQVTTAESRAMALTISDKFEKLLKKYTKKADDIDFHKLYVEIEGNIRNEKFTNVTNVLLEYAQKACGKDMAGKIAKMFSKL